MPQSSLPGSRYICKLLRLRYLLIDFFRKVPIRLEQSTSRHHEDCCTYSEHNVQKAGPCLCKVSKEVKLLIYLGFKGSKRYKPRSRRITLEHPCSYHATVAHSQLCHVQISTIQETIHGTVIALRLVARFKYREIEEHMGVSQPSCRLMVGRASTYRVLAALVMYTRSLLIVEERHKENGCG